MSLLEKAYEDFTVINKSVVDDGYGGVVTTWTDGAKIRGAIVLDSSAEIKIAQAAGYRSVYTLTVHKDVELDMHTVIRRESNGVIFRLTNNSDDKKTPDSASLNMRQYSAEEWSLPT